MPAHVVGMKALGISDPQRGHGRRHQGDPDQRHGRAGQDLVRSGTPASTSPRCPPTRTLAVSNGAYTLKDFKENQYLTLEKNPKYKGDHKGTFDTVTVRWNEDPMAQVQALKNGEIDMFSPQVTTDVVKAAEKVKDVSIKKGVEGTFEHMDLVQNNKGPFDPATYGGDAAKALLVRQAFLHGVPRQEIVDKLIKPVNADAAVRNSFVKTEGTPGYDEIVAANGSADYAKVDPAKSLALLKQAGVQDPGQRPRDVRQGQRPPRERVPALQAGARPRPGST